MILVGGYTIWTWNLAWKKTLLATDGLLNESNVAAVAPWFGLVWGLLWGRMGLKPSTYGWRFTEIRASVEKGLSLFYDHKEALQNNWDVADINWDTDGFGSDIF